MLRHPSTGLLLYSPLLGYGIYKGVRGRFSRDQKSKEKHGGIMPWILCLTPILAIDGGCAMKQWESKAFLRSWHCVTGAALTAGLFVQWLSYKRRDLHFLIGVGVTALACIHAITGISLLLKM